MACALAAAGANAAIATTASEPRMARSTCVVRLARNSGMDDALERNLQGIMRDPLSGQPSEVSLGDNRVALRLAVASALVGRCVKADDAAERGRPKVLSTASTVSLMRPFVASVMLKPCA